MPAAVDYIQANTNGRLHDAREASLGPLNRGFLYGDAVYEVWRTYSGVVFAWQDHWERLLKSADSIGISLSWSASDIFTQISSTASAYIAATGFSGELYIRLQIYRGAGPIGLDTHLATEPGFVILVKPVPTISTRAWESGLTLVIARTIKRNPVDCLNPAWKTGNYLNNLMGLKEARAQGADDVLFLNMAGSLTEASTSNIAFIKGDRFITPPTDAGILHGITRGRILAQVAESAGLQPVEKDLRTEDLQACDEAMLLSSTKDVQPVGRIDDLTFSVGEGTVSRKLKQAFERMARDYADAHPELAVQ